MPVSLLQPETKSFLRIRTSQFRSLIWKKSSCLQPDIWLVRPESAGQSDHTVPTSSTTYWCSATNWLIDFFLLFFFSPPEAVWVHCINKRLYQSADGHISGSRLALIVHRAASIRESGGWKSGAITKRGFKSLGEQRRRGIAYAKFNTTS